MRLSLVVSVLLLSSLLYEAKAIRLEKGFMQLGQHKIQVEEGKSTNKNGGFEDLIICKKGQCTGISSRKLATTVTTSATKKEERGMSRSSNDSSDQQKKKSHEDNYVEIMDYSPAKRKPPIHN